MREGARSLSGGGRGYRSVAHIGEDAVGPRDKKASKKGKSEKEKTRDKKAKKAEKADKKARRKSSALAIGN